MYAGEGSEILALAAPGSVVAMEATVAGLPPDALAAADDTGPIEPLDAKALQVPIHAPDSTLVLCTCSAHPRFYVSAPGTLNEFAEMRRWGLTKYGVRIKNPVRFLVSMSLLTSQPNCDLQIGKWCEWALY